jgi:CSLREA domain-containing protein
MKKPIAPSVTGTFQLRWRQCAAVAAGTATLAGNASAATIVVNSLADNLTPGNSLCTLREALGNANSNSDTTGGDCAAGSGADIIDLSGLSGTITLGVHSQSSPAVTVQGPGAAI